MLKNDSQNKAGKNLGREIIQRQLFFRGELRERVYWFLKLRWLAAALGLSFVGVSYLLKWPLAYAPVLTVMVVVVGYNIILPADRPAPGYLSVRPGETLRTICPRPDIPGPVGPLFHHLFYRRPGQSFSDFRHLPYRSGRYSALTAQLLRLYLRGADDPGPAARSQPGGVCPPGRSSFRKSDSPSEPAAFLGAWCRS